MANRRRGTTAIVCSLSIAIASPALGYGEGGDGGVPSHEERLVHVLTNQVRQAPHDWPGWDTSLATADPRPPLVLESGLGQAARFHANDLAASGTFSHDSSNGTPFETRIARYFSGPAGENIYMADFGGAKEAITTWMTSAGHRANILSSSWTRLGTGVASKGSSLYYVQDFGEVGGGSIPAIPGGALRRAGAGKLELIANYFDQNGSDPQMFSASLGMSTISLVHIAGAPGNETFSAAAPEPTGCERLTFTAIDSDGNRTIFPSTGALLAGAACTESFTGASTGSGSMGGKMPVVIDADTPSQGCTCVVASVDRSAPLAYASAMVDVGGIVALVLIFAFVVLLGLVVRKMAQGKIHAPERADQLEAGETKKEAEALEKEALGEKQAAADETEPAPEPEEKPALEASAPRVEAPLPEKGAPMKRGLEKTRKSFMARINDLLRGGTLDASLADELESILVTSDIGIRTAERLIGDLRGELTRKEISDSEVVRRRLRAKILEIVKRSAAPLPLSDHPSVIMVIGVNGVGKTTTIGKLAARLVQEGKKVVLAAGDTFRAAAVEQLVIWGERAKAEVVKGPDNGDPGAVVFEGIQRAQSLDADVCIADTAGRLHTKVNLMEELKKLRRVMNKAKPGAPHEVLLVLDATNGQNAIAQARQFKEAVEVNSIALTKLDGTAKGGVVVAICDDLGLPVRYVGIGEKVEDLRDFDAEEFVDALFAQDSTSDGIAA
jgi:fused signal recognition particle receptor